MHIGFSAVLRHIVISFFLFFFTDTATTEIYTLSLHDALPIFVVWPMTVDVHVLNSHVPAEHRMNLPHRRVLDSDRKSTRLNSSHGYISYDVFCLKKKRKK